MGICQFADCKTLVAALQHMQPQVRLYGTRFCPYCIRARLLLGRKGVVFEDLPVGSSRVGISWEELQSLSGRDTVPQIFIGDRHVGGCDDLYVLHASGELDQLLGLV